MMNNNQRQSLINQLKLKAQAYQTLQVAAAALGVPKSERNRAYSYQTLFEGLAEFLENVKDKPDFEERVETLINLMEGQESWEFVDTYTDQIASELLMLTDS